MLFNLPAEASSQSDSDIRIDTAHNLLYNLTHRFGVSFAYWL